MLWAQEDISDDLFFSKSSVKDIQVVGVLGATIFERVGIVKVNFVSEFKERRFKALKFWSDAKERWQKCNCKIALFKLVVQWLNADSLYSRKETKKRESLDYKFPVKKSSHKTNQWL